MSEVKEEGRGAFDRGLAPALSRAFYYANATILRGAATESTT